MIKKVLYTDTRFIENTPIKVEVFESIDWEDLMLHKIKAAIHQRRDPNSPQNVLTSTYRTVKDWLIKGEL